LFWAALSVGRLLSTVVKQSRSSRVQAAWHLIRLARRTSILKRLLLSFLAVPALFASLATSGCGYYTNIPAQITVLETKPGRISYSGSISLGTGVTKVDEPEVTLRAEPGSIGATYNKITVTYYRIDGTAVGSDKLPPLKLGFTFHVDSSNFPSNPMDVGKPIDQSQVGKSIWLGRSTFVPPIMTRHVEQYGSVANGTDGNQAGLFAKIELVGSDDANYDASLTFFVPIIFSGAPQ
jgi:hypothetical protein